MTRSSLKQCPKWPITLQSGWVPHPAEVPDDARSRCDLRARPVLRRLCDSRGRARARRRSRRPALTRAPRERGPDGRADEPGGALRGWRGCAARRAARTVLDRARGTGGRHRGAARARTALPARRRRGTGRATRVPLVRARGADRRQRSSVCPGADPGARRAGRARRRERSPALVSPGRRGWSQRRAIARGLDVPRGPRNSAAAGPRAPLAHARGRRGQRRCAGRAGRALLERQRRAPGPGTRGRGVPALRSRAAPPARTASP